MNRPRALSLVVCWLLLVALWVVLSGDGGPWSLAAGAVAAAGATWLHAAAHHADATLARPSRAWWKTAARLLPRAGRDGADLALALWRRVRHGEELPGSFRAVPYDRVGRNPRDRTHRTLATMAISLLPNSYVLGIDPDEERMVVHEMVGREGPLL